MSGSTAVSSVRETEVVEKAKRRGFTAEYKLRILAEAERAAASGRSGEVGAILRREGLYTSHLSAWRNQRDAGALVVMGKKKRGPAPRVPDAREREVAELKKKLARSEARLKRAELLLDLQKKVSELLGVELPPRPPDDEAER